MQNWNEKYLLKFISAPKASECAKDGLLNIISKFGIKLKFNNFNSVYQIIDEINFQEMSKNALQDTTK